MKLVVTALALACVSSALAQAPATDAAGAAPKVMPPVPAPKARRQAGPSGGPGAKAPAAPGIAPNATLVTLKGVCKDPQTKGACQTVITRQDVDRFASVSGAEVADSVRGRLAVQYARTVAFSSIAEKQGLDKDPDLAKEIAAQMKLARMRVLAAAYMQKTQGTTMPVAEAEIQKYYAAHKDQYTQAQVRRLSVPLAVPTESGHPLERAAAKAEVAELRTRAAAGEDFGTLQQEAYNHFHILASPPPTNPITLQKRALQGEEAKALDLKPGEVSEVLDLAAACVLMKVESKDVMPIESVRMEIAAMLQLERLQGELTKLSKTINAEFNLQYLDMPAQPDLFATTMLTNPLMAPARPAAPPRRRTPVAAH